MNRWTKLKIEKFLKSLATFMWLFIAFLSWSLILKEVFWLPLWIFFPIIGSLISFSIYYVVNLNK